MKCFIYLVAVILIAIIWIPLKGDIRKSVLSGYNELFQIIHNKYGEALVLGDKLENDTAKTLYIISVTVVYFFYSVCYLTGYSFVVFFIAVPIDLIERKFRNE